MVQLKKDEVILAVVLSSLVIVNIILLFLEITFINNFLPMISVIIAWYTLYLSRRPKESQFKFLEARIKDRDQPMIQVKVFVQNLGDGISLLRWEEIYIELNGGRFVVHSPKEWEWPTQPNVQTFKGFSFDIPLHIDLTGGYFIAKGAYSTHEEKMIEKTWKKPLSGKLSNGKTRAWVGDKHQVILSEGEL